MISNLHLREIQNSPSSFVIILDYTLRFRSSALRTFLFSWRHHTLDLVSPLPLYKTSRKHTLIRRSRQEAQAILARCLPFSPFSLAAGFVGAGVSFTSSFKNMLLLAIIVLGMALFPILEPLLFPVGVLLVCFSNRFIDASCSKRLLIRIDINVSQHPLRERLGKCNGRCQD